MRTDNEQTQYIGIQPIATPLYEHQLSRILGQLAEPLALQGIHTAGLLLTSPRRLLIVDGEAWDNSRTYTLANGTLTLDITPTSTNLVYGEWYLAQEQSTEITLRDVLHEVHSIWRFNRRTTQVHQTTELRKALEEIPHRQVVPADLPMTWDNSSYSAAPRGIIETGMPKLTLAQALPSLGIHRKVVTTQELVIR